MGLNDSLTIVRISILSTYILQLHFRFSHFLALADDQNAHLLTPSFALSGLLPDPPSYENMSPEELEAFLTEMEPDIRAADRDMREIEVLDRKGVLGAGKLAGTYPSFLLVDRSVYYYECRL